jgi:DNA modification methylase
MSRANRVNAASGEVPRGRVLIGDAATVMRRLPTGSVDMVFFSPPYYRLRDYGVGSLAGELGTEPNVEAWVDGLAEVCGQARRVLTPTGGLWLNLGDTWSGRTGDGAGRKSLLLGPERLALRLVQDGWLLRNKIIWAKPNHLPSGVGDRLVAAWEYLYFLTMRPQYFFDLDAVRLPHVSHPLALVRPRVKHQPRPAGRGGQHHPAGRAGESPPGDNRLGSRNLASYKRRRLMAHPLGKNPGDVWSVPPSQYGGPHRATMPLELARRAIMAGCPEQVCSICRAPYRRDPALTRRLLEAAGVVATVDGPVVARPDVPLKPTCRCRTPDGTMPASRPGLVLDPFVGSGTTAIAAEMLGRDWLGVELNSQYAALAEQRINQERTKHGSGY